MLVSQDSSNNEKQTNSIPKELEKSSPLAKTSSVMMSPPSECSPSPCSSRSESSALERIADISGLDLSQIYSIIDLKNCNIAKPSLLIPEGAKLLDHQVGGHLYRNGKVGFLADAEPGIVMKPIQSFPRGMIECAFYSRVFAPECTDSVLISLRPHMPRFHGVVHLAENGVSYMRLEDVTSLVKGPAAIMDVKMGRHTWDPRSSDEKRKRADGKYPYAAEIGFQITGFRTHAKIESDHERKTHHFYSDYTRKIKPDELIPKAFRVFFGGAEVRRDCIERTILRLREIGEWFRSQRSFCFYSASLLLVHSTETVQNAEYPVADVKLIDFAHVYPSNSQLDDNFLHGLDTLIIYLTKLLEQTKLQ